MPPTLRRQLPAGPETVGFFGARPERFGMIVAPPGPTDTAVVLSPPLFGELEKDYRREVTVLRGLAASGVAGVRYDYRGTGNSYGDATEVSFDSMVEDAVAAADWVRESTGAGRVLHVGVRVGALVAASASGGDVDTALVEPVPSGEQWLTQLFRAAQLRSARPGEERRTVAALRDHLNDEGHVDLLADRLHARLRDSLASVDLEACLTPPPSRLLVVSFGADEPARPALVELTSRLGDRTDVELTAIGDREVWVMTDDRTFLGIGNRRRDDRAAVVGDLTSVLASWSVGR